MRLGIKARLSSDRYPRFPVHCTCGVDHSADDRLAHIYAMANIRVLARGRVLLGLVELWEEGEDADCICTGCLYAGHMALVLRELLPNLTIDGLEAISFETMASVDRLLTSKGRHA